MRNKVIAFLLSMITFYSNGQTTSPDVIGSGGDHSATAGGSVSWTIGEPVSDTYNSSGGITTKGFHQPADVSLASVPDVDAGGDVFLYPNPVIADLAIDFTGMAYGDYQIELFESSGKLVYAENLSLKDEFHKMKIDLSAFDKGMYHFRILQKETFSIKFFKVIKQ